MLLDWQSCSYSTGLKSRAMIGGFLIENLTEAKLICYTIIQSTLHRKRRWISLQSPLEWHVWNPKDYKKTLATGRQSSTSTTHVGILSLRMPGKSRAEYWWGKHPGKWALDTDRWHEVIILPSSTASALQLLPFLPPHFLLICTGPEAEVPKFMV